MYRVFTDFIQRMWHLTLGFRECFYWSMYTWSTMNYLNDFNYLFCNNENWRTFWYFFYGTEKIIMTLIRFFMKTNKDHNRMDGNTSVSVSTRWANQGRRVPLLRNKDILLHVDSQYVIFTCICVYKRNQKYYFYI